MGSSGCRKCRLPVGFGAPSPALCRRLEKHIQCGLERIPIFRTAANGLIDGLSGNADRRDPLKEKMLSDVVECGKRHFLSDVLGLEGLKRSDAAQIVQIIGPVMEIIKDQLQGVIGLYAEGGPVRDQIGILVNFAENDPRQEVTQPPPKTVGRTVRRSACRDRLL